MAKVRQNSTHRPLRVVVFTEAGLVDFPAEFPGGVTFRMIDSAGTVIASGSATGDSVGKLSYQWQTGDLATVGTYSAAFLATDGSGRTEEFPTGNNIEIVVVPAL